MCYTLFKQKYYLCMIISVTEMTKREKEEAKNGIRSGRGGARPGAGRPKGDGAQTLIAFRAPEQMARYIESQPNKTEFIKECINQHVNNHTENHINYHTDGNINHIANNHAGQHAGHNSWGTAFAATQVEELMINFFDIGVVAGFPIPLDNDERSQRIKLLQTLCPHEESSYLIRVKGNSMIDANIHDGDIVIVDKSNRNPTPYEVAVCELNGEYTLKRFERRGDEGWLIPANHEFPEIQVTSQDDFAIWGVVTYVIHKPTV